MSARPPARRAVDRLAAGFLLLLLAVGSLTLWVGIPAGCLYLASQVTETGADHYLVALPMTLAAMVLFGSLLFWINRLYLRVTGVIRAHSRDEPSEEAEGARFARGPLELFLVVSLIVALVALLVWFFVFAENPSILVF